jgi:hypothetical protein
MAARKPPRKKAQPAKRVRTVKDESYTELEMYCIWLNEYYHALLKSGFKSDLALAFVMEKSSYPSWVNYRSPYEDEIKRLMEEDDDE